MGISGRGVGPAGRPVTAGGSALAAAVALVATLAASAPPLAAQGFCFRGQPRPDCSGFLLFDFHGHHVLAENGRERVDSSLVLGPDGEFVIGRSTHHLDGFTWAVAAEAGYARNVSPSWALGGTVGFEGVEGGPRVVLNGRARRWLGSGFALDLIPGVFFLRDLRRGRDDPVTGALLGARLDLGGLGFLSLRYEAMHLERDVFELGDTKRVDPGGFQHALSAGAGFGSQAGIVVSVVAAAIVLVALASFPPG